MSYSETNGLQHSRVSCPSLSPRSLLKLMSIQSVMPSSHLILSPSSPVLSFSQHQGLFQTFIMLATNLKLFTKTPSSIRQKSPNSATPIPIYIPQINLVRYTGLLLFHRCSFLFSTVIEMYTYCISDQANHGHHLRLNSTFPYKIQYYFIGNKYARSQLFHFNWADIIGIFLIRNLRIRHLP